MINNCCTTAQIFISGWNDRIPDRISWSPGYLRFGPHMCILKWEIVECFWFVHFDDWLLIVTLHACPPLCSLPPLLSVGASPSGALHPGSVPTAIWLWNIIWNSHAFEVDTAGAISQHSRGVLSAPGGGGGGSLAQPPVALGGSAWQIIDLSGKKWQHGHVCECSDCYRLTTWRGDL